MFSSEGESRQRFLMTFPGNAEAAHSGFQNAVLLQKLLQLWENCPAAVSHLPQAAALTPAEILRVFLPLKIQMQKFSSALHKLVLSR